MKWLAPAKINLSLRVLDRRADGFHEIETLMVPLDLADELEVTLDTEAEPGGIVLGCSDPSLPTGDGNLAYRAAALFRNRFGGAMPGVRIQLTKRVPHGAGLGGGSSDAATVLFALNALCQAGLSTADLAALAAGLGSDVPFFVYRSAAMCRGRGEQVTPVDFAPRLPLLLIKPLFSIPTPWAYKSWLDSREFPGLPYAPQVFPWGELVNDLERPVYEKYLVLGEMKRWLLEQQEVNGALMSGSGSTMVAMLRGLDLADELAATVRQRFGEVWTCACATAPAVEPGTDIPVASHEIFA